MNQIISKAEDFDYASEPEFLKDADKYLIAWLPAFSDMPDFFGYVEHLKELFEDLQWFTDYLHEHYEEDFVFWYELVDQTGTVLIPLQEVFFAYD